MKASGREKEDFLQVITDDNPSDHIFVKDFVKTIEIGAYQSERGCKQKVQFDVTLDIEPNPQFSEDNLEKILSYELIVDAINKELESQRFNLLEPLAEKIAERCLEPDEARRVTVEIQKLERISGRLGVRMVREKLKSDNVDQPQYCMLRKNLANLIVVHISSLAINSEKIYHWLDKFHELPQPILIFIDRLFEVPKLNIRETVSKRIDMLLLDQNAWFFSDYDHRLCTVSNLTELVVSVRNNKVSVCCPSNFIINSSSSIPDYKNSTLTLAKFLAQEFGADRIVSITDKEEFKKNSAGKLGKKFENYSIEDWPEM